MRTLKNEELEIVSGAGDKNVSLSTGDICVGSGDGNGNSASASGNGNGNGSGNSASADGNSATATACATVNTVLHDIDP